MVQPLHELLDRIRWDAQFSQGTFALGYYDRIAREEILVPFRSISIDAGAGTFTFRDEYGAAIRVPLHRVRTVYRDGDPIWRRSGRAQP